MVQEKRVVPGRVGGLDRGEDSQAWQSNKVGGAVLPILRGGVQAGIPGGDIRSGGRSDGPQLDHSRGGAPDHPEVFGGVLGGGKVDIYGGGRFRLQATGGDQGAGLVLAADGFAVSGDRPGNRLKSGLEFIFIGMILVSLGLIQLIFTAWVSTLGLFFFAHIVLICILFVEIIE